MPLPAAAPIYAVDKRVGYDPDRIARKVSSSSVWTCKSGCHLPRLLITCVLESPEQHRSPKLSTSASVPTNRSLRPPPAEVRGPSRFLVRPCAIRRADHARPSTALSPIRSRAWVCLLRANFSFCTRTMILLHKNNDTARPSVVPAQWYGGAFVFDRVRQYFANAWQFCKFGNRAMFFPLIAIMACGRAIITTIDSGKSATVRGGRCNVTPVWPLRH